MIRFIFKICKKLFMNSTLPTISNESTNNNSRTMINSGSHATQQQAGRDINIFFASGKSAIDNTKSINDLLNVFGEKHALQIVQEINDPLRQMYFSNTRRSIQKYIDDKFEKASVDSSHPKAHEFNAFYEKAMQVFEFFIDSRDDKAFLIEWKKIHVALEEFFKNI